MCSKVQLDQVMCTTRRSDIQFQMTTTTPTALMKIKNEFNA